MYTVDRVEPYLASYLGTNGRRGVTHGVPHPSLDEERSLLGSGAATFPNFVGSTAVLLVDSAKFSAVRTICWRYSVRRLAGAGRIVEKTRWPPP
eukprot:COSAG02_NODE_286_length_25649_cov_13.411272_11_plen_94_part_00